MSINEFEAPRYALYYAPESRHPLWRFGSEILGYDAATGHSMDFSAIAGVSREDWFEITKDPRHYGFHATLKAPFYLPPDRTEDQLLAAAASFAKTARGPEIEALAVTSPSSFIALTPLGDSTPLQDFALKIVEAFEPFRAPLSPADRARRLKVLLTARQLENLDRYGYPYIGDDYLFHMTLTSKLTPDRREQVLPLLTERFAEAKIPMPLTIDAITVFKQPTRSSQFHILDRFAFEHLREENELL